MGVLLILTSLFTIEIAQGAKPSKLAVTATAGDRKATLRWTAPTEGADEYDIKVGSGDWVHNVSVTISGPQVTFSQNGVLNGIARLYRVRGVNSDGDGTPSDWISVIPNIPAPTGLEATAGNRQVALSWTKPSDLNPPSGAPDLSHYEYTTNNGSNWTSTDGTDLSYTVTGLTNGTEYIFKVRAVRVIGSATDNGLASEPATATLTLTAPTNLKASPGDTQVTLSWTAPSGSIDDYVYKKDNGGWLPTGSTDLSYLVTGLENEQPYTFQVAASSNGRRGTPSASVNATPKAPQSEDPPPDNTPPDNTPPDNTPPDNTPPDNTPPDNTPPGGDDNTPPGGDDNTLPPSLGLLTNFVANVVPDPDTNTAKAILTWEPPSNAQNMPPGTIGYAYRYRSSPWGPWTFMNCSGSPYTVRGLDSGKNYEFQIRAFYCNDGMNSFSSVSKPKQRVIQECPVGWIRSDGFAGRTRRALLYEVKLEMELHNPISVYKPDWVAIYVHPDEGLENLDGWKLQVAIPYNHHREYLLTAENSVVVEAGFVEGGFAFIENPKENPFPMVGMGFTGSPVPGFDYRLYDETGKRVDFGVSCYKRFDVFQVLKVTEDPRVLRKVLLESFDWDSHYLRSEWTVPMPASAAPSLVKKNIVGTWGDLKKQ